MLIKCNATIVLTVILLTPLAAQGLPNWDVFNDAVMDEPDAYNMVNVYDTPPSRTTLTVLGGYADHIAARDSSILNVFGGRVTIAARDHSVVNINGGVLSTVEAQEYGVVNFFDGAASSGVLASDFATVNVLGGTVHFIGVGESGVITLSGGEIADSLGAEGSSLVNIYGSQFGYDPLGGARRAGQITGFWPDGTGFTIDLRTADTYSHVNFIPEPSALVVLTLGALLLRKRK